MGGSYSAYYVFIHSKHVGAVQKNYKVRVKIVQLNAKKKLMYIINDEHILAKPYVYKERSDKCVAHLLVGS